VNGSRYEERRRSTHHDHHVELLGLGNELHGGVVDDHRVELDTSVTVFLFSDSLAGVEEKTVSELHDVGFVNTGDFLFVSGWMSLLSSANDHFAGEHNYPSPQGLNKGKFKVRYLEPSRTFLLFLIAKSNANLAIRSALTLVETFKLSTTPG
jgi:hypothetical protein